MRSTRDVSAGHWGVRAAGRHRPGRPHPHCHIQVDCLPVHRLRSRHLMVCVELASVPRSGRMPILMPHMPALRPLSQNLSFGALVISLSQLQGVHHMQSLGTEDGMPSLRYRPQPADVGAHDDGVQVRTSWLSAAVARSIAGSTDACIEILVICRERMARMVQRLPTDAELAGALLDCMLLPMCAVFRSVPASLLPLLMFLWSDSKLLLGRPQRVQRTWSSVYPAVSVERERPRRQMQPRQGRLRHWAQMAVPVQQHRGHQQHQVSAQCRRMCCSRSTRKRERATGGRSSRSRTMQVRRNSTWL